jgi:hypothetical protein
MKQIIRVLAVVLLAVTVTFGTVNLPAHAALPSSNDVVNKLLNYFDDGQVQAKSCRKGSFSGATFSLRSFEGQLCNQSKTISAVAEAMCRPNNVDNFIGSKCDKAALNKLGADDSNIQEKAANVLVSTVKNSGGNTARLACKTIASFVPVLGPIVESACSAI